MASYMLIPGKHSMLKTPEKILVIRNDKLGDFMLAYPTFNAVKKSFPDSTIYALVPEYTRPMADVCPWIDEIILDEKSHGLSAALHLAKSLKHYKLDAALCLHSEPYVALALYLAGIPHRFAPASRIDQIFFNHRVTQRRSKSIKPEYEYNLDLANYMAEYYSLKPVSPDSAPYLSFPADTTSSLKNTYLSSMDIPAEHKIVIIHAGTGGSAINLNINQYSELVHLLSKDPLIHFVLTAGPSEKQLAENLSRLISDCKHTIYHSTDGLEAFSRFIAIADLFISGSTGVLHIAGAINVPTVAFYPARRSATSIRWRTLNSQQKYLSFSADDDNSGFESLDINSIHQAIISSHII